MQFSDWQVIGRGVYEGTPQLSLKWTGSTNILTCTVLGKDGNLYEVEERAPGQWGNPLSLGGVGTVSYAPLANRRPPTIVHSRNDNHLYAHQGGNTWQMTGGNGRLMSEVVQYNGVHNLVLCAGQGMQHKAWVAQTNYPAMHPWEWTDLGYPAPNVNVDGRLALTYSQTGAHILAHGSDNRLYHRAEQRGGWSNWRTVADDANTVPVVVTRADQRHIECYFVRKSDQGLGGAIWDGTNWHTDRIGGGLTGLPAVASSAITDRTYVFTRGTDVGKQSLYYKIRNGNQWMNGWGEGPPEGKITTSPSIYAVNTAGNERIVCVALSLEGNLVTITATP